VLAALLALPAARSAAAQAPRIAFDSAQLVRITPAAGDAFRARLLRPWRAPDALRACVYPTLRCNGGDSTDVRLAALADVARVQIAVRSRAAEGAVIGGLATGLVVYGISSVFEGVCSVGSCRTRLPASAIGVLVGVVLGAGFGSSAHVWADAWP